MKTTILTLLLSLLTFGALAQAPICNPDANESHRQRVTTSTAPNAYTCYMETKRKNRCRMKLATSFLIHPRVILTAGHNLAFYPGEDVVYSDLYFGSIDSNHYLVHANIPLTNNVNRFFIKGYWSHGHIQNDFSIIILPDSSIYKKVGGCYEIHPITAPAQLSPYIHITGSPGDKTEYEMWTDSTSDYGVVDGSIRYDLYTQPRNSGSPIWQRTPTGYQVVGIHSRSFGSCNASVLINQAVYDQIKAWCQSVGVQF